MNIMDRQEIKQKFYKEYDRMIEIMIKYIKNEIHRNYLKLQNYENINISLITLTNQYYENTNREDRLLLPDNETSEVQLKIVEIIKTKIQNSGFIINLIKPFNTGHQFEISLSNKGNVENKIPNVFQ